MNARADRPERFSPDMETWHAVPDVEAGVCLGPQPLELRWSPIAPGVPSDLANASGGDHRVSGDPVPAIAEPAAPGPRRARLEALGRIAGGVAHDLNNLLGIISNLAELQLLTPRTQPAQVAELSRQIVAMSRRGAVLTRKLASIDRPHPSSPWHVQLCDGPGGFAELVRCGLGRDIDLRVEVCRDPWPVHVDPTELQFALLNLSINSHDAMPDGGTLIVSVVNTVLSREEAAALYLAAGDYVEIRVTDTGSGMSQETLGHVFEAYFSTKSESRGTGLGLSGVHEFARNAGGSMRARSEAKVGTTITMFLPRDATAGT